MVNRNYKDQLFKAVLDQRIEKNMRCHFTMQSMIHHILILQN